jgi:hypothetical protein
VDVVGGGLASEGIQRMVDVTEREPAACEVDRSQGQCSGLVGVERMNADQGDQQLESGVGVGGRSENLDRLGA